jgi:hypothetical protein
VTIEASHLEMCVNRTEVLNYGLVLVTK